MSNNIIVYDVETTKMADEVGGWNYVFEMGIATCVTYSYIENRYRLWGDKKNDHVALCEYMNGCTAVGFNTIGFDSRVLLGNDRVIDVSGKTTGNPFNDKEYSWKNYDIMSKMWQGVLGTKDVLETMKVQSTRRDLHRKGMWNLDSVAAATLGGIINKSGDGALAPQLYKDGKIKELFEYNIQDVRVERELFEFVQKYKYIVNGKYDIVKL
jgi:hypothetical protein